MLCRYQNYGLTNRHIHMYYILLLSQSAIGCCVKTGELDKEIQFDQQVYYFQELVTKYVAELHKAPYYIFMLQDQIIEQ